MLQVSSLSVSYGAIAAVDGVSLAVPAGAIVTLIGGNGAGKTTTLRALSGLLRARAGSVVFDGAELTGRPPHEIVARGLGHVPEGRMIFANLTVDENLRMGAYLVHDAARVAATRERVFGLFPRLRERLRQSAGTLSGGEQQMLAIGRALMARPKLLLLDEPSMGLAPVMIQEVYRAILRLKAEGTTLLLVEQFARTALQVADYAYVMERGRITVQGTPEQLGRDGRVVEAYLG